MRHHVEVCRAGTQTVEQYCKEQGINKAVYYYWHKRFHKQDIPATGFVPVSISDEQSQAVTMHFPNGISIGFQGNVNTSVLKELVCCI